MSGQPWDVYLKLGEPANAAAAALTRWDQRDDTRAQPHVRQAANTAMTAFDTMLTELHQMRARLVSEIRASDDANGARADAILASSREVTQRG